MSGSVLSDSSASPAMSNTSDPNTPPQRNNCRFHQCPSWRAHTGHGTRIVFRVTRATTA